LIGSDRIKIPLSANTFVNGVGIGNQQIEIWTNGEKITIDGPFSPYFLSKQALGFSDVENITEEKVKIKLLSDLKTHSVYKYTVPSSDWIQEINKSLNKTGLDKNQVVNSVFENHIKYLDRILIDQPDYFLQYANTDPLTFFAYDIETLRENYIDKKEIISIAYSYHNGIEWEEIQYSDTNEKELLEWFLSAIEKLDPDILVGYFHRDFDLPRIIDRCKANNLNPNRLGRESGVEYYVNQRFNETHVTIPGRVLYDLFDSVKGDQTLYGIKNRKMKTVCQHFNIEGDDWVKEDMGEQTVNIPKDILKLHNVDDIRRTIGLFKIYWQNILTQSELFGIPLNMVAETASQTLIATLFMGRGLFEQGIMSDGMNKDRYPEVFRRKKEKGEKNYEAAIVGIYKTGLIRPVHKADFSGMYPGIEMALNLSPETCKITRYLPYKDEFKIEKKGNITYYFVPDRAINKIIVVAVNNKRDGFLRKELRQLRKKRNVIKEKLKTADAKETDLLTSQSWNVKILMNIVSGNCGDAISRYGSLPVTIVTVGVGRELIKELKKHIDTEYDNASVELDTDGIIMDQVPDPDAINAHIRKFAAEKFGIEDVSDINVDCDEYKAGYFLKQKNYVLQELNNEIVYHGVSLKSARQPKLFDSARDTIVDSIFNNEQDIKKIINRIANMKQYTLPQFSLRTTLHQDFKDYSKGSLQKKLGKQGQTIGIKPEPETQYEYVKETGGWKLIQFASIDKLDYKYYDKIIAKLCTTFNFEQEYKTRQNKSLGEWI
jgi:DNA polymerase elongation subunit (family B)